VSLFEIPLALLVWLLLVVFLKDINKRIEEEKEEKVLAKADQNGKCREFKELRKL
jgi:hypothetical protein